MLVLQWLQSLNTDVYLLWRSVGMCGCGATQAGSELNNFHLCFWHATLCITCDRWPSDLGWQVSFLVDALFFVFLSLVLLYSLLEMTGRKLHESCSAAPPVAGPALPQVSYSREQGVGSRSSHLSKITPQLAWGTGSLVRSFNSKTTLYNQAFLDFT